MKVLVSENQYESLLKSLGYARVHQTKYATEFFHETAGELVYIKRKSASTGLVIHPRHEHFLSRICAIPGITFSPGINHYKHNSNFRRFPKRMNKNNPICYGLEFMSETHEAAAKLLRLLTSELEEPTVFDEISEFEDALLATDSNERDAIVKARLGQGPWRAKLDKLWGTCALTGCDIRDILRGSHIKPWKKSSNEEKLDARNGLLLRADVDALFDRGLITFLEDGSIKVSAHLTTVQQESLPFSLSLKLREVPDESKKYFDFHRREVFKGEA